MDKSYVCCVIRRSALSQHYLWATLPFAGYSKR